MKTLRYSLILLGILYTVRVSECSDSESTLLENISNAVQTIFRKLSAFAQDLLEKSGVIQGHSLKKRSLGEIPSWKQNFIKFHQRQQKLARGAGYYKSWKPNPFVPRPRPTTAAPPTPAAAPQKNAAPTLPAPAPVPPPPVASGTGGGTT